jgi:protein-tyrosine phosphatase
VQGELDRHGIPIKVVPGGEVDLLWALERTHEERRLVSYGQRGTDLLVETPYTPLVSRFEEMLFELALSGYRLLLAHPERNPTFQESTERVEDLVRRGVLLQVTASSLLRPPRASRTGATARRLVERGLVQVIASDAHAAGTHRDASLVEGTVAASKLVGEARARWMVVEAPAAILAGQPLPDPPGPERPRRGVLRRRVG